jgi:hypothetical protein
MQLSRPGRNFDPQDEARVRAAIERADAENLKRGRDIEVGGGRLILTSPDGTRFRLIVGNDGSLGTEAL